MMFRFLTSGESHGPGLTAILEGIPAGLKLSAEDIDYHCSAGRADMVVVEG